MRAAARALAALPAAWRGCRLAFAQDFAARSTPLPIDATVARNCVRWNEKRRRYELVVNGEVTAHASRLKMAIPATRERFLDACESASMAYRATQKI